ncbi:hypothetical protein SEA_EYRE_72 [Gordonia phage Eyre]|uniref:Uncharacterized protein n=1 Tax=Gordonia phage Eyre TaxID=1887646 RepID=A0A1B3B036_9CAUD|nr:hypothetical protein BIZ73_gp72 [Gordonia phage Eyre]AOE44351.1 hypothetical protein SEA_EYRE_72 [Gordonia phage Eyre]
MARAEVLTLTLGESELEAGVWCPRCNLPSGWRAPLLGLSERGVTRLGTVARCIDCDQPL